jgi:mannitol/fructose-specific phosphotransferase system IIA component (Ntr-type)
MHPSVFKQLSKVGGFSNVNGDTYQKHITIILDKSLNDKQIEEILNCKTDEEALELLKTFKIPYSSEMT